MGSIYGTYAQDGFGRLVDLKIGLAVSKRLKLRREMSLDESGAPCWKYSVMEEAQ